MAIRNNVVCACVVVILASGSACLAAGERTPFKEKFPKAAKVFPLIGEEGGNFRTGFPVLRKLLELNDPWQGDVLKNVFPTHFDRGHTWGLSRDKLPKEPMELMCGTKENPVLFVDRRYTHDWRYITEKEWKEKKWVDWPGLKVWDYWAYVTDFYVYNPARPLIRLHLGVPPVGWSHMMKPVMLPDLPQSVRKDIPAKLENPAALRREEAGPEASEDPPVSVAWRYSDDLSRQKP